MAGLPDILARDLDLVICGPAVSGALDAKGHYYADPTNKFWQILSLAGLTPRTLQPHEDHELLSFGIGLTDLVKDGVGSRHEGLAGLGDVTARTRLEKLIINYRPQRIAFNGKRVAREVLGRAAGAVYGRQYIDRRDWPEIWILPHTSGRNGNWDEAPWHALGTVVRSGEPPW